MQQPALDFPAILQSCHELVQCPPFTKRPEIQLQALDFKRHRLPV
jgi:hypothetical protein